MGTLMAPNYANIYLSSFENKLLKHPQFKTSMEFLKDLSKIYSSSTTTKITISINS
jgi:hypothetical protein